MKQIGNTLRVPKGFTLVELVVVMAIIAVLVSLALFAINAARLGGRNTQRRSDVQSVKIGLESYFGAQSTKQYPNCATTNSIYTGTCPQFTTMKSQYLPNFPTNDSAGHNGRVCYQTNGTNPQKYGLAMKPETLTGTAPSCTGFTFGATITPSDSTFTENFSAN